MAVTTNSDHVAGTRVAWGIWIALLAVMAAVGSAMFAAGGGAASGDRVTGVATGVAMSPGATGDGAACSCCEDAVSGGPPIHTPATADATAERLGERFQLTDPPPAPTTTTTTTTVPPPVQVPANSGKGRRIVYSKADQRVWLVTGNEVVERTYLVSGSRSPNLPTPGEYEVFSRSETSFSLADPDIVWRFMVRFTTGPAGDNIGFHEIPVDQNTGDPVQSEAELGRPRSAGCVRQATDDAIYLWGWAPIGTRVVVLP